MFEIDCFFAFECCCRTHTGTRAVSACGGGAVRAHVCVRAAAGAPVVPRSMLYLLLAYLQVGGGWRMFRYVLARSLPLHTVSV